MQDQFDIRNERGLDPQEASLLVSEFLKEHPAEFAEWVRLEMAGEGVEPIWEGAIAFLKRHCLFKTRTDLSRAGMAMRLEFYGIALQDKEGKN